MQSSHYLRKVSRVFGGSLIFSVAIIAMHAQSLPAMPLTNQAGQAASAAATPVPNTPLHAEVIYTNGQLQVRADNSSLNQILRSISHVTGLKITGGVEEQRVFGNYGPAPLSTILATLLDGTGANILLLGGSAGSTPELVLTPRAGGAEPPGPNSPAYAMYDDKNDRDHPVPPPGALGSGVSNAVQLPATISPSNVSPPSAGVLAPSTARTPGQALTPEIVEQQLLQMQAQQDQKKKELDDNMQQQVDQKKRLDGTKPPSQTVQPTNGTNPQQ
jgi:hypothetical protein